MKKLIVGLLMLFGFYAVEAQEQIPMEAVQAQIDVCKNRLDSLCGEIAKDGSQVELQEEAAFLQFSLSVMYVRYMKDPVEGVKWMLLAAENGSTVAMSNYGYFCEHGIGMEQNIPQALEWYRKAVELGDLDAKQNLALAYHQGKSVPKDEQKAYQLWREAADEGNRDCYNSVGYCFEYGQGVPKNTREGFRWYTLAHKAGDKVGSFNFGRCLYYGIGTKKDYDAAFAIVSELADDGDPEAMALMGECYFLGNGVVKSKTTAVQWYQQADENGYAYQEKERKWLEKLYAKMQRKQEARLR